MAVTALEPLLYVFLVSLYVYVVFLRRRSKSSAAFGFKTYPIVGTLPDFILNRHRFLEWSTGVLSRCQTKTAVFHRPGKVHGVITANPQVVEHMLKTNFENYPKGERFRILLQDLLGTGIFNADGEMWRFQRKTASYEFNTKSLRNFAMENVTSELRNRLIPLLQSAATSARVLDVQDILERFAFDNICKLAFNVDPVSLGGGDDKFGDGFMEAFDEAASLSSGRFMYAIPKLYILKKLFNLGSEKKLQKSIARVHEYADKIIANRYQKVEEDSEHEIADDLLSRFILRNENSPKHLRDIVISFILAGRDTTSSALSWFFWLLSNHQNVEERILQELETIRKAGNKSIGDIYTFEELHKMHYLQAAITESMRLYPPVPVDTKACKGDDILPDGTVIKKDWFISYNTYAMGRMESIWGEDCCEYRPERWIENGVCRGESAFKYPVFHAGPRMCLGKEMAYIQMKSIAASVLERFAVEVMLEKGQSPQYLLSLTLRIKGGLPVRVRER
ncbi:cytochrome P450 CYP94D108-like [Andrographis paniculata]|uniref:cytochrome P450 CYP94D108-like n=1 Tax=Andrographis paniculata TaxID=175694 RepID=UPI0021E94422|nr:cytochrome P450 CYP94D108-like [Andrographis paniculata]